MSDDEETPPHQPFVLLTGKDATLGAAPPRLATQAQINERLGRLENLTDQVIKRIGQLALMVDGFGGNLNRRIDVLHEEAALMRATLSHPANDIDVTYVSPTPRTPVQKASAIAMVPVKFASYATLAAVVLRLVAKQVPEYEEAIDSFLKAIGL